MHVMRCAKSIGRSSHQIDELPRHDDSYQYDHQAQHRHHQCSEPAYRPPLPARHHSHQYEEARSLSADMHDHVRPAGTALPDALPYDESTERVACDLCNRKFAANRLEKHMDACRKVTNRNRKVFDMTAVRTEGTEAAKFYLAAKEKDESIKPRDETPIRKPPLRPPRDTGAIKAMKVAAKQAGEAKRSIDVAVDIELSECEFCGRKFSLDALERHTNVCREITKRQAGKKPDQSKPDALLKRTQFKAPLPAQKQHQVHTRGLQQGAGPAPAV
ncbi:hypothetical protein SeLEV6574_g05515 [Synchytrium endobioticum]|nr:hypothetical protein SeLEV6574_g05515 [Synchytrium endobioticum]